MKPIEGKSDCVVIIPTYNERENAAAIIEAVMNQPHEMDVLVVDDGSPDGTAAIVRGKMEEYPGRVHLLERSGKLGLGTAYITGFKWAIERKYEYIFEMDADFSHNPDDLMALRCGGECGQLAHGARAHVLLRIQICAHSDRNAHPRHHRGICVLSPSRARNNQARRCAPPGLCFPD